MATRNRLREIDHDVLGVIVLLFKEGHGAAEIRRRLQQMPSVGDRIPHPRTIQRLVKDMRGKVSNAPQEVTVLDQPFAWHKLEEYGLPWEAGPYLLKMWAWVRDAGPFPPMDFAILPPTGREARWWWRIHLLDQEKRLRLVDVWNITQWFVARESLHQLLDMPLQLGDLEAYLAYKAWLGENREAYDRAVDQGRIPGIQCTSWELVGKLPAGHGDDDIKHFQKVLAIHITGNADALFPNPHDSSADNEEEAKK